MHNYIVIYFSFIFNKKQCETFFRCFHIPLKSDVQRRILKHDTPNKTANFILHPMPYHMKLCNWNTFENLPKTIQKI